MGLELQIVKNYHGVLDHHKHGVFYSRMMVAYSEDCQRWMSKEEPEL